MSIHYHGTPITPQARLYELAGRNFCISYAAPEQVEKCHAIGQSVMLDNGAFSFWRSGKPVDWEGYYEWVRPWLEYKTTWAVIPDYIGGSEEANDSLITDWFCEGLPPGAPVWHMHESILRLKRLCQDHARVCLGSSAQYATVGSDSWHRRMDEAMNELCGNGPAPNWLHMLRGMDVVDAGYPFASVDSTNIAQNHNRNGKLGESRVDMANRLDARQAPARWRIAHTQEALCQAP